MTVRETMSGLIERVRVLIGDEDEAMFDDQAVQDALDRHREDIHHLPLRFEATYSGNTVSYRDFYADMGEWESGCVLYNSAYAVVEPDDSDLINGHWSFEDGQDPPLFVVGRVYDIWGAAADLLTEWAAHEKLAYDVDADGQSFRRSQRAIALERLAEVYRRRARASVGRQVRNDVG